MRRKPWSGERESAPAESAARSDHVPRVAEVGLAAKDIVLQSGRVRGLSLLRSTPAAHPVRPD